MVALWRHGLRAVGGGGGEIGDEAGMEFENGGNNLSQFVDFIALLGHIYVTLILLQ